MQGFGEKQAGIIADASGLLQFADLANKHLGVKDDAVTDYATFPSCKMPEGIR